MKARIILKPVFITLLMLWGVTTTQQVSADQAYLVKNVDKSDVLNIRKYPGSKSKIIATIPPTGSAIHVKNKKVRNGSSTWVQVEWQGVNGWVNKYFLMLGSASSAKAASTGRGGSQHTHPKNKCTRSISHKHPNGSKRHVHSYSCKKAGRLRKTSLKKVSARVDKKNSHVHPKQKCTNSITHSHPNGKRTHTHRYNCKNRQNKKVETQKEMAKSDPDMHTHKKNKCTRSISHTHPNGKGKHTHRYSCEATKGRMKEDASAETMKEDPNAHTHPKKKCTRSVTHTHPNGQRSHVHRYSCQ